MEIFHYLVHGFAVALKGVAGPEACNNATVCGTQIPLFSLGIPTNTMNTMLLSALMIFGMTPGPNFIRDSPDLFWGLVASMYIGNILCLILNLPLIPLWVKVLKIPHVLLNILILIFCIVGSYSLNQQVEDFDLLIISGLNGFVGKKLGSEPAPAILAFVLGPKIEGSLRQSLIISDGSFGIFFTRPITLLFMIITLFILMTAVTPAKKKIAKYTEGKEDF